MTFRLQTIDPETLDHVRRTGLDPFGDPAERITVSESNSAPCRATLEDAVPGEDVLLLRYAPLTANTPYRFTGPVFVRASDCQPRHVPDPGVLPEMVARRLLSLRAFTADGRIHRSDVSDGREAAQEINAMLAEDGVASVHIHAARNGCWLTTAVPA